MPDEEFSINKTKKFLTIGLISVIFLVLIFLLARNFVFKPSVPPQSSLTVVQGSPEDVAIKYLRWEQKGGRKEAERYFYPFAQVKIFKENYRDIIKLSPSLSEAEDKEKKEGPEAEYQVKESKIGKTEKRANVVLEETANKEEGSLFFGFILPEKITFEITLAKYKDYWKIVEINSPDLVLESKIREKAKIKKDVFVKLIEVEDYTIKGIKPKKGFKFLSLEVEYENKSKKPIDFQPFSEWRIISISRQSYSPISLRLITGAPLNSNLRGPALEGGKLSPGSAKKGYVSFNVPQNILADRVVFQNIEKKIIFELPQKPPVIMEDET